MIDFDNLEKVTSVICAPTPNLTIKHSIVLRRKPFKDSSQSYNNDKSLSYGFDYKYGDKEGLYFHNGTVLLEFEAKRQQTYTDSHGNSNSKKASISAFANVRDIPILVNTIDRAYKWLTHNAGDVFIRDVDGRPIKIVDPLLQIGCPVVSGNIAFKPCIVRDIQDVRYEGIAMVTHKDGELTNFTGPEFATFRMVVTGFGSNYYLANQMLINQALAYCTNNNLMEVLTRNAKSNNKSK